jgi:Kdo2-lipid IVA lauroyltransferase/acyltransferase
MLFFKLLSLLPFSILYLISDLLYFLSAYVFKYRRKVIETNLRNSFPDKDEKEIQLIVKKFYHNLADIIVEIIKTLSLSEKELAKRVVNHAEIPAGYLKEGKSILVLAGHLCNWEWLLLSCSTKTDKDLLAVYRPLHNKFFDKLMLKIRTHMGAIGVPINNTVRELAKRKNIPFGLAMVADQTSGEGTPYWGNFLNQETGFLIGGDKIAKLMNLPVFFVEMKRLKRGYYEVNFKLLKEPPYVKENFEILEAYQHALETSIKENPSDWLWSHRRWKHKRANSH